MTENLRLKVWFHWTDEERSHAIYNAYSRRILKSHEIKNFLMVNRLNNVSNWGFPLLAYPLLNLTLFRMKFAKTLFLTNKKIVF
jgi:hypothetical protein